MAAGIGSFARRPKEFEGQPSELVTHVSDGRDLRCFAGKRVAVISAGQSALESAALIHENGGEVEVIVRKPPDAMLIVDHAERHAVVVYGIFRFVSEGSGV